MTHLRGMSIKCWQQAQRAEREYWWRVVVNDAGEFARITAEKVFAIQWALSTVPDLLSISGPYVEIGIGPLGVGCVHLLPDAQNRRLVGIDPLPQIDDDSLSLPSPFCSLIEACRSGNYKQVQARGEETGLNEAHFALAVCYNALDHCCDPKAALKEICRILKPNGYLLLGCDVVSSLSLLKFHLYVKRVHSQSIGVRAHPFHFQTAELENLVKKTGCTLLAVNRRRYEFIHRLFGRAHRMLIVGRKKMGA